jgi:hypothetical protein
MAALFHRAALLRHGLTERDIVNPPICRNECGFFVTYPPHEEKIRAFEETEFALLYGLFERTTSTQYRRAHRVLDKNLREGDIMRAAEHLAIFHQTHEIEITYSSLARVLGMSKSSMYRTYRGLVGNALKLAHKKAVSPTLADERVKERNRHPGLKGETYQQEREGGQPTIASSASNAESAEDDEDDKHDLHAYSSLSRKVPRDLAFEDLCDAARHVNAAGKPMNERNIYLTLRRHGRLAEGEKLSDYFDVTYVANAVRAVTDSQSPRSPSTVSRCSAA